MKIELEIEEIDFLDGFLLNILWNNKNLKDSDKIRDLLLKITCQVHKIDFDHLMKTGLCKQELIGVNQ